MFTPIFLIIFGTLGITFFVYVCCWVVITDSRHGLTETKMYDVVTKTPTRRLLALLFMPALLMGHVVVPAASIIGSSVAAIYNWIARGE